MSELLEDPDGAPYPEEVQALVRWVYNTLSEVHLDDYQDEARDLIGAAVEAVAEFETPDEQQRREARGDVLTALITSEFAGDAGKIRAVVMPSIYGLLGMTRVEAEAALVEEEERARCEKIWDTARDVINAVYGTDDRHAFMALKIARHVVYGEPVPWDLARRADPAAGARYVQLTYSDPGDLRASMRVGTLRARLEGRADDQIVVLDTGNGRDRFLPIYAVADDDARVVMEL